MRHQGQQTLSIVGGPRKFYAVAEIDVIVLIIQWTCKEGADAFHENDEYRPYRESRIQGARNEFFLLAGEEVKQRLGGFALLTSH